MTVVRVCCLVYFTLRLPVINDIMEAICVKQDPVLFKIDIARAFRNLRADCVENLALNGKGNTSLMEGLCLDGSTGRQHSRWSQMQ